MKISTRDGQAMIALISKGEKIETHGALSGEPNPAYVHTGRLPEPYADDLRFEVRRGNVTYVMYSYATPIAWKLRDGTVVSPDVSYSVTTSQHQGKARYVLNA